MFPLLFLNPSLNGNMEYEQPTSILNKHLSTSMITSPPWSSHNVVPLQCSCLDTHRPFCTPGTSLCHCIGGLWCSYIFHLLVFCTPLPYLSHLLMALWWTQVFCIFSDVYLKYLSLQIGCADWIKVKVLGERILRIQKKPFHNRLPADFCFNFSFWNILSRYLSSLALERVTAIAKMAMCKAAFAIVLRPCLKSWSFSKCETIDLFVLLLSRNWLSLWKATIISWPTIKHPDGVPGAKYGAAFVRVVYLGPFERIVCWRGWAPLPP